MPDFIKETDNRGRTYIVEGTKCPKKVFKVNRFICQVQDQETEKETQELADLIIHALEQLNNETR